MPIRAVVGRNKGLRNPINHFFLFRPISSSSQKESEIVFSIGTRPSFFALEIKKRKKCCCVSMKLFFPYSLGVHQLPFSLCFSKTDK